MDSVVGALSGLALPLQAEKPYCSFPLWSLFFPCLYLSNNFHFIAFYDPVLGELTQLSQIKFMVRKTLSWLPVLAITTVSHVVRLVLNHTHVRVGKASKHIQLALFANVEAETFHHSGTCSSVQTIGKT